MPPARVLPDRNTLDATPVLELVTFEKTLELLHHRALRPVALVGARLQRDEDLAPVAPSAN